MRRYETGEAITMNNIGIIVAWIISTAIFAALILYASKHLQKRTLPLKVLFIVMFLGGMAMYCTINYRALALVIGGQLEKDASMKWVNGNTGLLEIIPYVVMRSIVDVGRMFCGYCNSEMFYKLPESGETLYVLMFWFVQLLVFYTTATALLIRVGNDLLRWIRVMTSKISDVDLVFGVNSDSLAFGRNIAGRKEVCSFMLTV